MAISTYSCVKESETNQKLPTKKSSPGYISAIDEVDSHLQWIARGLAYLSKDIALANMIHNEVLATTFQEQTIQTLNSKISFTDRLTDSLDFNIPNNDYKYSSVFGFNIDGYVYSIFIHIPDSSRLNKPFRIVPDLLTFTDSLYTDSIWGYYVNPSGQLDSSIVNIENEDDFYIWIVNIDISNNYFGWGCDSVIGSPELPTKKSLCYPNCKIDCVCELDESPDCPDCLVPRPNAYTLKITELHIGNDRKKYNSQLFGGKYHFALSYAVYEKGDNFADTAKFLEVSNHVIKTLKRSEVCRVNNHGTYVNPKNCKYHVIPVDITLIDVVYPELDPEFAIIGFDLNNVVEDKNYYFPDVVSRVAHVKVQSRFCQSCTTNYRGPLVNYKDLSVNQSNYNLYPIYISNKPHLDTTNAEMKVKVELIPVCL